MQLQDGARIGVIGGGPAGSFTSYFLYEMAERVDIHLNIDIYEPQDFARPGPGGCNHCGGIISESLVQMLATEGINIPASVVQRGLDSYVVHTEVDNVRISTPLNEKRIATMHRGSGPIGSEPGAHESFDSFLLNLAKERGAHHILSRVKAIRLEDGRPVVTPKKGEEKTYDLLVGAVGVNYNGLKLFEDLGFNLEKPKTTKTHVCEFHLGSDQIQEYLGNSMHVFLLDSPGVEFAALIPKGEYVTFCMLGDHIDQQVATEFITTPVVAQCLPPDCDLQKPACKCFPQINIGQARNFFTDRIVLIGDCGTSRLYKDGIGAAYRAAKACAITAVFQGVGHTDFERFYWPACQRIERDNGIGKAMFFSVKLFQRLAFLRSAVLKMTRHEQTSKRRHPAMSSILWDMFTGSSPYRDIFLRSLKVDFIMPFTWECFIAFCRTLTGRGVSRQPDHMTRGT